LTVPLLSAFAHFFSCVPHSPFFLCHPSVAPRTPQRCLVGKALLSPTPSMNCHTMFVLIIETEVTVVHRPLGQFWNCTLWRRPRVILCKPGFIFSSRSFSKTVRPLPEPYPPTPLISQSRSVRVPPPPLPLRFFPANQLRSPKLICIYQPRRQALCRSRPPDIPDTTRPLNFTLYRHKGPCAPSYDQFPANTRAPIGSP